MIYEFSPKQDLHGYDEPWAPGAGKNLLIDSLVGDAESLTAFNVTLTIVDGKFKCSGTSISDGGRTALRTKNFILPAGTYYLSRSGGTGSLATPFIQKASDSSIIRNAPGSFTLEEETEVFFGFNLANGLTYNYTAGYQVESGSSSTSWVPYENICPISGYNIWDPDNNEMIQVYSGYVDAEARKLYLHPVYEEYDGEELVGPWISSLDKYTEEGTPTTGAFVVDFGGDLTEYDITPFMLQTLLDSLGIRRFIASGAMLLNSLMDQAQGRVRSEEELINLSLPIHVIAIGKELPTNLVIKKPVSDVLPVLPGKI